MTRPNPAPRPNLRLAKTERNGASDSWWGVVFIVAVLLVALSLPIAAWWMAR